MFYSIALSIAGSDCSGGAGIQADIKTMSALGVYAASVITSVTVQNTMGVKAVQAVAPEIVSGQINAVMDDLAPKTIKIGMVNDACTLSAIINSLSLYTPSHIIVDPVMVSSSGMLLMQPDALDLFCEKLLPHTTLLTPNIPETETLAKITITNLSDIYTAAERILNFGCGYVLIKGGHLEGSSKRDYLFYREKNSLSMKHNVFEEKEVQTKNTHGTGCTLSSAIASYMARGYDVFDAVSLAKVYVTNALKAGMDMSVGQGIGPLNHFFSPEALHKNENNSL